MAKRKSVTTKLVPFIVLLLLVVFVINNTLAVRMLKNEVKEQWMQDNYKLAEAYANMILDMEYDTTEELQGAGGQYGCIRQL